MASKQAPGLYDTSRFIPGLNTNLPVNQLGTGQAADLQNVDLRHDSCLPRGGWVKAHTTALIASTPVSDVFHTKSGIASMRGRGLAVCGNSLYAFPGLTGALPLTPVLVTATLNTVATPVLPLLTQFVEINSATYMSVSDSSLSNQKLDKWDGTTLTVTNSPQCTGVATFNNSIWIANGGGAPNRVSWSGVVGQSGVDVWPAANFIDLAPYDGDIIMGFGRLHNALLVFKQNSVWRISGQQPDDAALSTGTLSVINLGIATGCPAPNSISSKDNQVIWLGRDGLYMYDGVHIQELSTAIRPTIAPLVGGLPSTVRGAWVNHHQYILATNPMFVFTLGPMASISEWKTDTTNGVSVLGISKFVEAPDPEFNQLWGMSNGFLGFQQDTATLDDAASVPWKYTTGLLPLGPSELVKIPQVVYARGPAGTDALSISLKGRTTNTKSATPVLTGTQAETRLVVPTVGRNIQMTLSGTATHIPRTEIDEVSIQYRTQVRP